MYRSLARTLLSLLSVTALCLLPVLLPEAAAQDQGDGTIYSRYGVGDLTPFSSSQIEALGGGGTALRSFNYVNANNPASWSDQYFTRAVGGLKYQHLTAVDAENNTSDLILGSLNAVQFSFPILTRELGVSLNFAPYSRANYRVPVVDELVVDPVSQDTASYVVNYEGRGGLQQFSGGLGYRFNNSLSVGASADVIFGIIEDARRTTFTTGGFASTNLTQATRLAGLTGTIGGLYTGGSVLRSEDELTLGASLTLPTHLTGNEVTTLGESLDRDTLGTSTSGSVTLPLHGRLGLVYRPNAYWMLVADGAYQPWSQFQSDFPGHRRFQPASGAQAFTDRLRFSGGVEIQPGGEENLASFLARTAYRLGAYYEQSYVQPFTRAGTSVATAQNIRTAALTGGVSLPTMISGTRLDLNLEVGTQGTTERQLVRDVFYRVSLNLNIGERWFQRQRLR